jgi:hypothetical protein
MFKLKYNFNPPLRVNFGSTNTGDVSDIVDNSLHIFCGREGGEINSFIYYQARVSFTG